MLKCRVAGWAKILAYLLILTSVLIKPAHLGNGFSMVEVHRYRENPIRNSFLMKSSNPSFPCTSKACETRNAYLTKHVDTFTCECQCSRKLVYSSAKDDCVDNIDQSTGGFVASTESISKPISREIPFYSLNELRDGNLIIRYCDKDGGTSCGNTTVSDCRIDTENSLYDSNGWKKLWDEADERDLQIINGDKLQLLTSPAIQYSGLLVSISISCNVSGVKDTVKAALTFAVEGIYVVPPPTQPPSTTTTKPTTTTEATTSTPQPTTSTTTTTVTTTPQTTITIFTSTTEETTSESITTTTTLSPQTTTSTIETTIASTTPTTSRTELGKETTISTINTNTPGRTTTIHARNSTSNNTTGLNAAQHSDSDDNSKMILVIVSAVLGTFLVISCFLVLCFYLRWKRAKKDRSNDHSMIEPPFFFQPETPVFLIGREGGKKNSKRAHHKTHVLDRASADTRVTASDSNLYDGNREPKKVGSIRQLYASIDKFLKPGKHKSNGSLDEGYTTDDNSDYRRFGAFPKDLYDEPGSVISSQEEPEYRIPEDFITSQMSVTKNNLEAHYLTPSDAGAGAGVANNTPLKGKAKKAKPPRLFAGTMINNKDSESFDSVESHYDEVGSVLSTQIQEACHAYDEVGQVLQDKIAAQELNPPDDSDDDYDEPHDSIRHLANNKGRRSRENSFGIVPNRHAIQSLKLDEAKF